MEVALKRGGSLHGGLLLAAVCAVALVVPSLSWPWYLLLPLLAYAAVASAVPALRRTAPPLALGAWAVVPWRLRPPSAWRPRPFSWDSMPGSAPR